MQIECVAVMATQFALQNLHFSFLNPSSASAKALISAMKKRQVSTFFLRYVAPLLVLACAGLFVYSMGSQ